MDYRATLARRGAHLIVHARAVDLNLVTGTTVVLSGIDPAAAESLAGLIRQALAKRGIRPNLEVVETGTAGICVKLRA